MILLLSKTQVPSYACYYTTMVMYVRRDNNGTKYRCRLNETKHTNRNNTLKGEEENTKKYVPMKFTELFVTKPGLFLYQSLPTLYQMLQSIILLKFYHLYYQ